jgi:hypothetical protein
MKIIKISDNLKINIEMLYSLEKRDNKKDIDEWENKYQKYLTNFTQDPPMLAITDDEVFQPVFGEEVDEDKMKLYGDALSNHIISIIGACPIYNETYFIILASGLKINIDKTIYDAIDKYLDKFLDKN